MDTSSELSMLTTVYSGVQVLWWLGFLITFAVGILIAGISFKRNGRAALFMLLGFVSLIVGGAFAVVGPMLMGAALAASSGNRDALLTINIVLGCIRVFWQVLGMALITFAIVAPDKKVVAP